MAPEDTLALLDSAWGTRCHSATRWKLQLSLQHHNGQGSDGVALPRFGAREDTPIRDIEDSDSQASENEGTPPRLMVDPGSDSFPTAANSTKIVGDPGCDSLPVAATSSKTVGDHDTGSPKHLGTISSGERVYIQCNSLDSSTACTRSDSVCPSGHSGQG